MQASTLSRLSIRTPAPPSMPTTLLSSRKTVALSPCNVRRALPRTVMARSTTHRPSPARTAATRRTSRNPLRRSDQNVQLVRAQQRVRSLHPGHVTHSCISLSGTSGGIKFTFKNLHAIAGQFACLMTICTRTDCEPASAFHCTKAWLAPPLRPFLGT